MILFILSCFAVAVVSPNLIVGNAKDVLIADYISNCILQVGEISQTYKPTVVILQPRNGALNEDEVNFVDEIISFMEKKSYPQIVAEEKSILNDTVLQEQSRLVVTYYHKCASLSKCDPDLLTVNNKYLIITPKECSNEVIDVGLNTRMYDVTFIMIDNQNNKHNFLSFIPEIDPETCKIKTHSIPSLINTCTNGQLEGTEVFPSKSPTNLNKCPYKVGIGTLFPYAVIKDRDKLHTGDLLKEVSGSDVEIFKIISQHFNATMELYYVYRDETNPYVGINFLNFLINGSLDACGGGFYRVFGDMVAYSGIYSRQQIVWVYAVERPVQSWQNFMVQVNGLYVFLVVYVVYACTWVLLRRFDSQPGLLRDALLRGWGALVGGGSLRPATTLKQKILNVSYLVLTIHLSAYISVQLYAFLTIQSPPQTYKTNDEMMSSGRTPYLNSGSKYFTEDVNYVKFANTSLDCATFKDCEQLSLQYYGATVVLDGLFIPFQRDTSVLDEARMLQVPQPLLVVYHEILLGKGSLLVKKFQQVILRLFEAGICERVYHEALGITAVAKSQIAAKNMMLHSYSCQQGCRVAMTQLAGAFYLWGVGCVFSVIMFVLEILVQRRRAH